MTKQFNVNGRVFTVRQSTGDLYYVTFGRFKRKARSVAGAHKDVLMAILGILGNEGKIDAVTANWPEQQIVEIVEVGKDD